MAIDSILKQTIDRLELIFIANGADAALIANFVREHFDNSRIVVIETPIAQLSHAMNLALASAKAAHVARMDADDISAPERLKLQLTFLIESGLDMVGCDLTLINFQGERIGEQIYPKGSAIDRCLPFSNPFAHNTIVAKKSVLIDARGYNAGYNTEDYDLWLRLRRANVKWDNMKAQLVSYRVHPDSSQRRLLGYAEAAGLVVREFLLTKKMHYFLGAVFHFVKTFVRPTRS